MKTQATRIAIWTVGRPSTVERAPVTAASALPGRRPSLPFWVACSGCLAFWTLFALVLAVL